MLTFNAAQGLKDPAILTRWFVAFEGQSDPYACVVETIDASFPKNSAKARFAEGRNFYYADMSDIEAISMTFYETRDYDVTRWLKDWRTSIYNPETGVYGLPSAYKRRIYLDLYSYEANEPILQVGYQNCWPSDVGNYSFSYENNTDRLRVQASFAVDTQLFEIRS